MLSPLRAVAPLRHRPAQLRFYATQSPTQIYPRPIRDPTGIRHTKIGGPLRPQLGFRVNPKHGLWAFFRKRDANEEAGEEAGYETIPLIDGSPKVTGRSWESHELRRKSFVDLHTLWYILLRERNLLVTQKETMRRMGVSYITSGMEDCAMKTRLVRKSMARIKQVLNERRLAYEGALKIHADNRAKVKHTNQGPYGETKARLQRKLNALIVDEERAEVKRIELEKLAAEKAVKEARRMQEREKVAEDMKEAMRIKKSKEDRIKKKMEVLRFKSMMKERRMIKRRPIVEARKAARSAWHEKRAKDNKAAASSEMQ